jgi:hypothetical protein
LLPATHPFYSSGSVVIFGRQLSGYFKKQQQAAQQAAQQQVEAALRKQKAPTQKLHPEIALAMRMLEAEIAESMEYDQHRTDSPSDQTEPSNSSTTPTDEPSQP